eukprot:CAMPEP_0185851966 /NCGR_PEP_ID=MMETSP1354-20130828/12600_1 /TAXON_ID=708628 /ORGANISM="Erythrolobus madagascarensis, Strain CCMP3276" /LENGTH=77 /DNA_ID=CAMNT_0028553091 /DNA_START=137 /DNA_END=370 /DNA_ORIENTATION=-
MCTVYEFVGNVGVFSNCTNMEVPCEPCACDPLGTLTCNIVSGSAYGGLGQAKFIGQCELDVTTYAECPTGVPAITKG